MDQNAILLQEQQKVFWSLFSNWFYSWLIWQQQIMGSLVKNYMANKLCLQADEIYHFSVMLCYDKKLEASRDYFYNEIFKKVENM